jgi:hypothetical protein
MGLGTGDSVGWHTCVLRHLVPPASVHRARLILVAIEIDLVLIYWYCMAM